MKLGSYLWKITLQTIPLKSMLAFNERIQYLRWNPLPEESIRTKTGVKSQQHKKKIKVSSSHANQKLTGRTVLAR